jgi:hypothetical protein
MGSVSGDDYSDRDLEELEDSLVQPTKTQPISIPKLQIPKQPQRSKSNQNFDNIVPTSSRANGKKTISTLTKNKNQPGKYRRSPSLAKEELSSCQSFIEDDYSEDDYSDDNYSDEEPYTEADRESNSESEESEEEVKKPKKPIKPLGKMSVAELKKIQKPINQKRYERSQKKAEPKKGRPADGVKGGKWSDTIECTVCGKKIKRSNRSQHNKTQYHKIYAEMNDRMRKLLFTK